MDVDTAANSLIGFTDSSAGFSGLTRLATLSFDLLVVGVEVRLGEGREGSWLGWVATDDDGC